MVLRGDVAPRRPHVDARLVHPSVSELHLESLKTKIDKAVTRVRRTTRKTTSAITPPHDNRCMDPTTVYREDLQTAGHRSMHRHHSTEAGARKSRDIAVQQPHNPTRLFDATFRDRYATRHPPPVQPNTPHLSPFEQKRKYRPF